MAKSNVIPLFPVEEVETEKPYAKLTTSPHFEQAWNAYPDVGRRRSSRKLAFTEWKKVAPQVGKVALVKAVERYVKEDKDAKRDCGAPAFHRWLAWGRWEHWLEEEISEKPAGQVARRFPDEDIRRKVAQELGEAWVVSWIDGCGWVEGVIICKGATNLAKLNENRSVLRRLGLVAMLG